MGEARRGARRVPTRGLSVLSIPKPFGVGAQRREGGPNPLVSVGWLSLIAGLSDFGQAFYIMAARPEPLGADGSVLISGLIIFYFYAIFGMSMIGLIYNFTFFREDEKSAEDRLWMHSSVETMSVRGGRP